MNNIIKNILSVNPYKVELSIVDYQNEGIKLEVFLLDENYNVLDVFTASQVEDGSVGDLVHFMTDLFQKIQDKNIACECLDEIQKC